MLNPYELPNIYVILWVDDHDDVGIVGYKTGKDDAIDTTERFNNNTNDNRYFYYEEVSKL